MSTQVQGAIAEAVAKPSTGWSTQATFDDIIKTVTKYTRDTTRGMHPVDREKLAKAIADRYNADARHWNERNAREGVPDRQ